MWRWSITGGKGHEVGNGGGSAFPSCSEYFVDLGRCYVFGLNLGF